MFQWDDRVRVVRDYFVPWIEDVKPLKDCTVLEYGSGRGAVAIPLCEKAKHVIGIDIDRVDIEFARKKTAAAGHTNFEYHWHPVEDIEAAAERYGRPDVFMLYAVLEHLTIPERIRVLRIADRVVADDGIIVVCESPNRLMWGDYHTSQTPFNFQLPDELAIEYAGRTQRLFYREAMAGAALKGRAILEDTFARLGRGLSYHEFELALGGLGSIVRTNYDPILHPCRHVDREEHALAEFVQRKRDALPQNLPACFTRYYIDCILRKTTYPNPVLKEWVPVSLHTMGSPGIVSTPWGALCFGSLGAVLNFTVPAGRYDAFMIHVETGGHEVWLEANGTADSPSCRSFPADLPRGTTPVVFRVDPHATTVSFRASVGTNVSFAAAMA